VSWTKTRDTKVEFDMVKSFVGGHIDEELTLERPEGWQP
jgi:hypothetical protein